MWENDSVILEHRLCENLSMDMDKKEVSHLQRPLMSPEAGIAAFVFAFLEAVDLDSLDPHGAMVLGTNDGRSWWRFILQRGPAMERDRFIKQILCRKRQQHQTGSNRGSHAPLLRDLLQMFLLDKLEQIVGSSQSP